VPDSGSGSGGGTSNEYGDCKCYCDGSYQGDIDVHDGQGGYGLTQSFCEDNGPAQCPNEGFTCASGTSSVGGTFTVSWVYESTYTGANFGGSPSGPPSGPVGDCQCLCGNGDAFDPQYFPNQAGPDPGGVTESECTSQGTVMCHEMWNTMVSNPPNVAPCSSGNIDEVYTAWFVDTGP
jgi:hypothetical protein